MGKDPCDCGPRAALEKRFNNFLQRAIVRLDILIVPFFLDSKEIIIYLVVCFISLPPLLALGFFLKSGEKLLSAGFRSHSKREFRKVAARVNLGYFLVGGGLAMIPLALGKICAPLLGEEQHLFSICLALCVGSHYGVSLFGASELINKVTGRRKETIYISSAFALFFLTYCLLSVELGLREFATGLAAMHLGKAFLSAVIVALRFGIWPGPTAILFGRIRLS